MVKDPKHLKVFPIWLLLGPRQVGKSSLLQKCGPKRQLIDLDNLDTRARANNDPELFAQTIHLPCIVDEIQYAPALLSPIKRMADKEGRPGCIWVTGSQNFSVMQSVTETLAGRVGILHLLGLSDEEKKLGRLTPDAYFSAVMQTSFPKLYEQTDPQAISLYLESYIKTYIERDVAEITRLGKRREFEQFLKMCALHTGQIINYSALAKKIGVTSPTIKEWISVLEDSFVIRLVHPYHKNKGKRLIKSPKLYFLDSGLAAHLCGYYNAEQARLGPMGGALLETHIFGQIIRYFAHRGIKADIYFWRTRSGNEIDFLVDFAGHTFPLEIKMGRPHHLELANLQPIKDPTWQPGRVLTFSVAEPVPISSGWIAHPLHDLSFFTNVVSPKIPG